jgi:hypothetical protein
VAGGVASLATIVGLAFGAWFAITDTIAGEARTRQVEMHAMELQREADEVAFSIYQVTHKLDEIEARADHKRERKSDPLLYRQYERDLDILLRRQDQVLEALEEQLKEK